VITLLALATFAGAAGLFIRGCSTFRALAVLVAIIVLSTAAVAQEPVEFGAMARRPVAAAGEDVDFARMARRPPAVVAAPAPVSFLAMARRTPPPAAAEPVAAEIVIDGYAPPWCGACWWYQQPGNFPVAPGYRINWLKRDAPFPVASYPAFALQGRLLAAAPIHWPQLKAKADAALRAQSREVSAR
jgi:hypothetical protein